jgi:hypothetical protein
MRCRVPSRCLRNTQKCAEVNAGCQARTAYFGVERYTGRFGERIETTLAQQAVQALIERVADGSRQTSRFDPDRLLFLVRPSLAQGHSFIVKRFRFSSQAKSRVAPRTARPESRRRKGPLSIAKIPAPGIANIRFLPHIHHPTQQLFAPELQSGEAGTVLKEWTFPQIDLWVNYPSSRLTIAKERVFVKRFEENEDEMLIDTKG